MAFRARKALDAASRLLDDPREEGRAVYGQRHGETVEFEIDGTGWRASARIPRGAYIVDVVRRIDRMYEGDLDLVVDVAYGDPQFDPHYIVGGAPRPFLERLLSRAQRRAIARLQPPAVRAADGRVWVEKQYAYYYAEPTDIALAIDLVASLAERIGGLLRDAERELLSDAATAGAPFRPIHDLAEVRRSLELRGEQVQRYLALEQERKRRNRKRVMVSVAVAAGWLVFNLVMAFAGH